MPVAQSAYFAVSPNALRQSDIFTATLNSRACAHARRR